MSASPSELRSILLPAADIHGTLACYREGLQLPVRLRDGDMYAELAAGSAKLALATPEEHPDASSALPLFRVTEIATTMARLTAHGATMLTEPTAGRHEIRATMQDPSGNLFVIYRSNG